MRLVSSTPGNTVERLTSKDCVTTSAIKTGGLDGIRIIRSSDIIPVRFVTLLKKLVLPGMRFRLIRIKELPVFYDKQKYCKNSGNKKLGGQAIQKNSRRFLLTKMTPVYEEYSENTFTV